MMGSPLKSLVNYNTPTTSPLVSRQNSPFDSQVSCSHSSSNSGRGSPAFPGTNSGHVNSPDVLQSHSNSLESLVNPPPPSELGEAECALLRGDAIGDTAYTQRWVLKTLLTITQALPQYIGTDDASSNDESQMNDDNIAMERDEDEIDGVEATHKGTSVLELAEDVESAACQLWDMTVEPDVVLHLLNFGAVDILQLATDIITLSRAPRLTEVVIGVVANLCCQPIGCEKVMNHRALLDSCLTLLHTTDDVPTLTEAFRLLRLLLWHLSHRMTLEERSSCMLIPTLKGYEPLKLGLIFMLKNSLSESLLSAITEFLETLLYLWLPDDQCYMAVHYAESGLVEGVVEVMRHFLKEWEKNAGQVMPKVIHRGVLILYSFVATPAAHLISSFDQYESILEPLMVTYVEHLAKVEKIEELIEDEGAEKLTYALGLCELLVPTMRHPSILLSLGRLLALLYGGNHHYTVAQGQVLETTTLQDASGDTVAKHRTRRHSRSRRRRSRTSSRMSVEENVNLDVSMTTVEEIDNELNAEVTRNVDQEEILGKVTESADEIRESAGGGDCSTSVSRDENAQAPESKSCVEEIRAKVHSLVESIIDYIVRVVRYCPDMHAVFSAVNECHVHEVQLFFRAIRSRDPKLVGQLQEQLLDTGSHNRLVTILSDMYT